jgi:hypothetical protein
VWWWWWWWCVEGMALGHIVSHFHMTKQPHQLPPLAFHYAGIVNSDVAQPQPLASGVHVHMSDLGAAVEEFRQPTCVPGASFINADAGEERVTLAAPAPGQPPQHMQPPAEGDAGPDGYARAADSPPPAKRSRTDVPVPAPLGPAMHFPGPAPTGAF